MNDEDSSDCVVFRMLVAIPACFLTVVLIGLGIKNGIHVPLFIIGMSVVFGMVIVCVMNSFLYYIDNKDDIEWRYQRTRRIIYPLSILFLYCRLFFKHIHKILYFISVLFVIPPVIVSYTQWEGQSEIEGPMIIISCFVFAVIFLIGGIVVDVIKRRTRHVIPLTLERRTRIRSVMGKAHKPNQLYIHNGVNRH